MIKTKRVAVDYGETQRTIDVPESSVVVEFSDPPLLSNPIQAIRDALADPVGSPPFRELVKPGIRVAIGFDDPTRPAIPIQTILPILVDELLAGGVRERDILLISAGGNHRKYTSREMASYLGSELFDRFASFGQVINHDCSDPEQLKFLGITQHGGYVEHNRHFVDADLMIYVGNVSATAWGGYTGSGVVVGLGSTRSISSHHAHRVIGHPNSWSAEHRPAADADLRGHASFRGLKDEISKHLELTLKKRVFYINAVGGTRGRLAGVFAGYSPEVEPKAWELADTFNRYPVPQADVMIIGLPQSFAYGSSHNQLIAAVGVLVPPRHWLNRPVLREGGVVIGLCPSMGEIDPRMYPSYDEVIKLYGRHHHASALVDYEGELGHRSDYLQQYMHGYGYPPLHPFWLFYENDYTLSRAGRVIMAGTTNPAAFRSLGITPASEFSDAWSMATRSVGSDPVTVVAPSFWSRRVFKFDVQS